MTRPQLAIIGFVLAVLLLGGRGIPRPAREARAQSSSPPTDNLDQAEAQLAEKFDRLEVLASRLAELSGSSQPRRAALLRDLIAQSRERDIAGQFESIIAALEQESYSSALAGQTQLHADLSRLLELLLQEDRDRNLNDQRKRVRRYLQDVNRIIRLERGVRARTDGGDDERRLAADQQRVGDETKKLAGEIEEAEGIAAAKAKRAVDAKNSQQEQSPEGEKSPGDKPSDSPHDKPRNQDGKQGDAKPNDDARDDQAPDDKPRSGDQNGTPESSSPVPPSDRQPPSDSPQQGSPQRGSPQQGSDQSPSESSSSDQPPPSSPEERATDRLRAAQQRMQQAQESLERAQRKNAADQQQQALEELAQAKAELERILRQLREEELERMLVLLEARFRKMLDAQIEVYDETRRLDAAAGKAPAHELEIAGGRLRRQEEAIVREADRALVLLREDGTSVAFPEAIEQSREDMKSIAGRLGAAKFEMLTQGLEEDVIASLEETLAALQQAIKDLRDQRARQQQPSGSGEPGEQPLVDQLAELRMIRALQLRVNKRTQRYGAMVGGEQAADPEILEGLQMLSVWQQKVFQATRELDARKAQQ